MTPSGAAVRPSDRALAATLGVLFVATGAVGLLLEQALEKLIATVIGASTPAAAIVLAVYFAGLALGGALYAKVGMRLQRPLLVYAALEAFVGAWALFIRLSFESIQAWSASAVAAAESPSTLMLVRFLLSSGWILPPTIAMGASFPAIVGALSRMPGSGDPRRMIALFYTLNLLGAIGGTALGAYWLLPLGGPGVTLIACVAVEVIVCVAALSLDRVVVVAAVADVALRTVGVGDVVGRVLDKRGVIVVGLAALSGFSFFAFEVVAVHLVGATVGTSAYAFADMLAAILIGLLFSGALVALVGRGSRPVNEGALGAVFCAAALSLAATTALWDDIAQLFLLVHPRSFAAGEAYRFLFSALLLVPVAATLGAIYPLLFRLPWFDEQRREAVAGFVVAGNAAGCFLGALAAAFVFLPGVGSQDTLRMLAACLGVCAIIVAADGGTRPRWSRPVAIGGTVGIALALLQPDWNWRGVTRGVNVYFRASYTELDTPLLFVHEDAHGGVTTVVENADPGPSGKKRVLLTNGKFQGDDATQMPAQAGFALVPLIHTNRRERALVIGLGTGHSAEVVADAGFEHVDLVELAPGIVAAARGPLSDLNSRVLDRESVQLHLDDGRNFVLRARNRYDLVTIEISSVWFAGATNMYAREFYVSVRDKLTDDGILQQWVQLHHISRREVLATLLTLRDVFPEVELFLVGGQGVLVASKQDLSVKPAALAGLRSLPSMRPHLDLLASHGHGTIDGLVDWRIYDDDDVDALHQAEADHVRNTDMNRFLEYATPRYQLQGARKKQVVQSLLETLPTEKADSRALVLLANL